MNQERVKLNRKDYVKSIIDSILNDDEKLTDMANQCFGGIEAIQSVYEAINVYGVDREILRKHINKMLDEQDTIECPTCEAKRYNQHGSIKITKCTNPDCKGGRVSKPQEMKGEDIASRKKPQGGLD